MILIFAITFVRLLLQTRSWSTALRQQEIHSGFRELMLLRLASQGVGYLSVLGAAASEPLKIKLLQRDPNSVAAATLVDSGLYWLSGGLIILVGGCSAALYLNGPWVLVPWVSAPGAIMPLLIWLIARSKSSSIVASPRYKAFFARLNKIVRVLSQIREFARRNPLVLRQMFVLNLACQVLLLAEVAVALSSLHLPVRPGSILAIEASGRGARILGGWMPARIGADESFAAGAFGSLGLPVASGLAFALVRRLRDMVNSLVGLVWLAWRMKREKTTSTAAASVPALVTEGL